MVSKYGLHIVKQLVIIIFPVKYLCLSNFWDDHFVNSVHEKISYYTILFYNVLLYHTWVWSSIVSCMKKVFFVASFFRNISKTAETILIKKIGRNPGISVYKKALISKHRKNYIFRHNNCFAKMSVSLLVSLYVPKFLWTSLLKNYCEYQISNLALVHWD